MDINNLDIGLEEAALPNIKNTLPDKMDEVENIEDETTTTDYDLGQEDISESSEDKDMLLVDVQKQNANNARQELQNELSEQQMIEQSEILNYINFLQSEDKELIDLNKIISLTKKYLNYINSEDFKNKQSKTKLLLMKFSNYKKYSLLTNRNNIDVYKLDNKKGNEKVASIQLPNMVRLDEVLPNLEDTIFNMRNLLNKNYLYLLNNSSTIEEKHYNELKSSFIKEREQFINILNLFYFLQCYYNKLNKLTNEKKTILLSNILDTEIGNHESIELVKRIKNKPILLSENDKKIIYDIDSNKLNLFNKINELMTSNTNKKELDTLITKYINYDKQEIIQKLDNKLTKLKNRKRIKTLYLLDGENINELFKTGSNTNDVINRFKNIRYDDDMTDEKRKANTKRYFILKSKGLV